MRLSGLLTIVGLLLVAQPASAAPSFDCDAASHPDEFVICASDRLSRLDVRLVELYEAALAAVSPARRNEIEQAELDWLESRHQCGRDTACIRRHYVRRIAELAAIVGTGADDADPAPARVPARLGSGWERLAVNRIERRGDRDVVRIGRRDGRFEALRLRVLDNDARIRRVRVVYGNGDVERLDVDRFVGAGELSEVMQLRGRRGRFIDRVTLVYGTMGRGPRATVELWGKASLDVIGGPRLGPDWKRLASEVVERGRDRDVIRLGREDGRFDSLRLRVLDNDVRVRRVRVVYGNGRRHDLDIGGLIEAGTLSDALDLRARARGRFIRRIVLVYGTRGRGPRATVEVWGHRAGGTGGPGFGPDWKRLETKVLERRRDRDVFWLSRDDGRFDALRMRVLDSDVRLDRVRVVFGNGRRQDVDVRRWIDEGEASEPLRLRGPARGRFIDRVVFAYRAAGPRPEVTVELWGRRP